jgi:hypothetical protein
MFLALAAQEHHVAIPKDLIKYWDVLEPVLGRPLTYRARVERFNKARVGWKHYGTEPAATEIDAAVTTVTGLLADECEPIFGVALDAVSLASFVRPDHAQDLLLRAERALKLGDEDGAFADLIEAFGTMLQDYEQRKMTSHRRSVFGPHVDFTFLSSFFQDVRSGKERDFIDGVIASIDALDQNIKVIGFGIDFRRYGKFKALTPHITRFADGRRQASEPARDEPRTAEDFAFCRDFVIDSALKLAEFDFDLEPSRLNRSVHLRRGPSLGASDPKPNGADDVSTDSVPGES